MMEKMIFGRFIPGDSIIHRMDPRAKILFVFVFIAIVFIANSAVTYGILLGFTLLVVFLSKIRLYFLINGLKPVFILRSEERRVGKECRSRWSRYDDKQKMCQIRQALTFTAQER